MSIKQHLEGKVIQLKKIYGQKKALVDKTLAFIKTLQETLEHDLDAIEAVEEEIVNLKEIPSEDES